MIINNIALYWIIDFGSLWFTVCLGLLSRWDTSNTRIPSDVYSADHNFNLVFRLMTPQRLVQSIFLQIEYALLFQSITQISICSLLKHYLSILRSRVIVCREIKEFLSPFFSSAQRSKGLRIRSFLFSSFRLNSVNLPRVNSSQHSLVSIFNLSDQQLMKYYVRVAREMRRQRFFLLYRFFESFLMNDLSRFPHFSFFFSLPFLWLRVVLYARK